MELTPKEFGARITQFRTHLMLRQQDMADLLGVSQTALAKVETGRNYLKLENIIRLVDRCRLNAGWLLTGRGPMQFDPVVLKGFILPGPFGMPAEIPSGPAPPPRLPPNLVPVPILSVVAALGAPREVRGEQILDYAVAYKPSVPHPKDTYAIRASGDSMAPFLVDGALVGVDLHLEARTPLHRLDNKMVVVRLGPLDNDISIKWLRVGRTSVTVEAENPDCGFLQQVFRLPEAEGIVIGRVVWWWGEQ